MSFPANKIFQEANCFCVYLNVSTIAKGLLAFFFTVLLVWDHLSRMQTFSPEIGKMQCRQLLNENLSVDASTINDF